MKTKATTRELRQFQDTETGRIVSTIFVSDVRLYKACGYVEIKTIKN